MMQLEFPVGNQKSFKFHQILLRFQLDWVDFCQSGRNLYLLGSCSFALHFVGLFALDDHITINDTQVSLLCCVHLVIVVSIHLSQETMQFAARTKVKLLENHSICYGSRDR